MKKKKIELMAPAGSFSTLVAACNAGADAVYFGLSDFSMRSGKKNFKVSDLERIRKVCNSYPRKPKMYLTLNTIVYDNEIKKLEKLVERIKGKIDGVICFDFAVIDFCKKNKIPFFISTQNSVSNKREAEFYKKLGAKRIVLARELSLQQIKEIGKIEKLEIEVFVHGAMCVAISGRCFASQFLFNRSANRGDCLHPCRRSYTVRDKEKGYELDIFNDTVMSAKDICTLPIIEDLKKANIDAFKIEGRNRDERYVDTVVRFYRKAIDKKLKTEELLSMMEELEKVFNRGFSTGFYLGKPGSRDFANVENSAASTYREFVGRVINFYSRKEVALVKLSKTIKIGEEIIFIGKSTGIKKSSVLDMECDKKKIQKGEKGSEVGLKIPFKLRKGDQVYRVVFKK